MDISYPGRFVPKTIRFSGRMIRTQRFGRFVPTVWTIRTQGLDISYPRAVRFVPNAFLIFCIWSGIFASKIVRFIQPIECWLIRTYFLFISHTWIVFCFFLLLLLFYMDLFTNVWFFWVKDSWIAVKLNQGKNYFR